MKSTAHTYRRLFHDRPGVALLIHRAYTRGIARRHHHGTTGRPLTAGEIRRNAFGYRGYDPVALVRAYTGKHRTVEALAGSWWA